jgi:hypothetical protein
MSSLVLPSQNMNYSIIYEEQQTISMQSNIQEWTHFLLINTLHRSRVDSPQGMRVLQQCKVPRVEVIFVIIQRQNIRPQKKEMNKAVTILKQSDVSSYAMNDYVYLSLNNRKSSVHLHALYSPRIAIRTSAPRRDQLVICGQYIMFTPALLCATGIGSGPATYVTLTRVADWRLWVCLLHEVGLLTVPFCIIVHYCCWLLFKWYTLYLYYRYASNGFSVRNKLINERN